MKAYVQARIGRDAFQALRKFFPDILSALLAHFFSAASAVEFRGLCKEHFQMIVEFGHRAHG